MSVSRWFNPKKHTGWKKEQGASTRRRHLISSTRKNLSMDKRRLEAGRRALALANVTRDEATRKKAKADANYFFRMLK